MHVRLFQALVVISTVSYLLWFFFPYLVLFLANDLYREISSRLGQYDGYAALLPMQHPLYYWAWFCSWLIASIGLFFFQSWARNFFLVLTVLALVLTPFGGFAVKGPLAIFFAELTTVLDGAILALAFLSPLSSAFAKPPDAQAARTQQTTRA
jgi:hypothetical protein